MEKVLNKETNSSIFRREKRYDTNLILTPGSPTMYSNVITGGGPSIGL